MHRYSYPITIQLDGGKHTSGHYIVEIDQPIDEAEQERRRKEYEANLNSQMGNPLLPGAKYSLGLPQHRKMRK